MKLKESFTYPDTDVESVYALITDPAFREEAVAAVGGTDIEVTVEPTGDGHTVTVIQTQPANVPDFIKKFIGDSVKVKQTETWGGTRRRRQPRRRTSGSPSSVSPRTCSARRSSPAKATSPSWSRAT